MALELTQRQAHWLAFAGVVVAVLGSAVAVVYAMDYRLVETSVPADHADPVAYDSLSPAARDAVDRALAGDGPWYRTRGDAPVYGDPLVVEREDALHAVRFRAAVHWATWRAKLPLATGAAGLGAVAAALRAREEGWVWVRP